MQNEHREQHGVTNSTQNWLQNQQAKYCTTVKQTFSFLCVSRLIYTTHKICCN